MKHRRITTRRATLAGTAAAGLAAAILLPGANASPSPPPSPMPAPKTLTADAAARLAAELGAEPGSGGEGSYYDEETGRLVVNVLDRAAAERVGRAGAVAKVVKYSAARLRSTTTALGERARIPGTAWAVDPVGNQVVVTADRTVTGAELDRLHETVDSMDGTVRIEKTAGEFKLFLLGGDAVYSGGARCSLGFNVVKDGAPHFITAGHCGVTGTSWAASSGGAETGTTVKSSFPGDDYSLVEYSDPAADSPSEVNLYNGSSQRVSGAAEAAIGMKVRRSGSTTQVRGGTVTGLNVTVNYQEGSVSGLIRTNVCAEPGDSGGPLFADDKAIGLTSGGSGDCTVGGVTFFQPVTEALQVFGAKIG